jgi:drug/metabolite transporter (DMT)-like permease
MLAGMFSTQMTNSYPKGIGGDGSTAAPLTAKAIETSYSWRSRVELSVVVCIFFITGPAIILLNKHIMRDLHFHFPILLSSLGNLLIMIVTRSSVKLGVYKIEQSTMTWTEYMKLVMSAQLLNFSAQSLGMICYMYISVPLVQILKCLTLALTSLFALLIVGEQTNSLKVCGMLAITVGTLIAAAFDGQDGSGRNKSLFLGVLTCVLSSSSEALRSVVAQVLFKKWPLFDGLYWSSPAFILIASIVVGYLEAPGLVQVQFTYELVGKLFLSMCLCGVIVLVSNKFTQLCGAVVLKISAQGRTIGLVFVSVLFFGEECAAMQYMGYGTALGGMAMFEVGKRALAAALESSAPQRIETPEEKGTIEDDDDETPSAGSDQSVLKTFSEEEEEQRGQLIRQTSP